MKKNTIYLIISILLCSCSGYNSTERAYIKQSCTCTGSFAQLVLDNKPTIKIMKKTLKEGFYNPQRGDGQITDEFMTNMDRMAADGAACQAQVNAAYYGQISKFKNLEMFSTREFDQRLTEHCPQLKKSMELLKKK